MGMAKQITDVHRGDQIVTNGQWDRVHDVDTAKDGAVIPRLPSSYEAAVRIAENNQEHVLPVNEDGEQVGEFEYRIGRRDVTRSDWSDTDA